MEENLSPNGEYLTVPDLVDMLGLTPSKVRRLIEDHHLAAVRIDGVLKVPAEFVQDGRPLASLHGTLLLLLDAGYAEAEAVAWLLSENEELERRPVDALRAGHKSSVRRAVQSLAF